MDKVATDVATGIANNFLDYGLLGAVCLLVIIACGIVVWYLNSIIKELKAEVVKWQGKYEVTVQQQIEENRNLGQVVEALSNQRTIMSEMHLTLKILERGGAR